MTAAKKAFYGVSRFLARFLSPDILYYLLYPYSALGGLGRAFQVKNLPVAHLPPRPTDRSPGLATRWRYQASVNHRWRPLYLADLESQRPRWADRITAEGDVELDAISAERPVIVVTLHTGAMLLLGAWLVQRGLGVGSVIIDRERWLSPASVKMRADPRWQQYAAQSAAFLAGDTRQMVRFVAPKRVLVLQADHLLGRTAEGSWPGGRLTLAVGALRIARITGATVIPVVATDDGRWRFRVHVGTPLAAEMIQNGDDSAAVTEIARQLMPIAAQRPFEALAALVRAVSAPTPTAGVSRASPELSLD